MRVVDVFVIRGRGPVASVVCDTDVLPFPGYQLRRASDGSYWNIRGVERHAINVQSWVGSPIGLLLSPETTIEKGDEVSVIAPRRASDDRSAAP